MLFGKKSRLAPEERRERVQAIERLVNADKDDEAFRLTQALEKEDGAGLAMACFYTMGENVGENYTAAALRAPKEGLFRPVRLKERGAAARCPTSSTTIPTPAGSCAAATATAAPSITATTGGRCSST